MDDRYILLDGLVLCLSVTRLPSFRVVCLFVFFFNDTATTEIYTLSLPDALPISPDGAAAVAAAVANSDAN